MFSNTAYEAFYRYLGLVFHSGSIQLITSEPFFKGLILIIFGGLFLLTAWQFVSRHMLGQLVERHPVPLSKFVKLTFCLVLGISILKVGGTIGVRDFRDQNWDGNPYVTDRVKEPKDSYEVSFVFEILSRSAEEIGKYMTFAADYIFGNKEQSYLNKPFEYAKAMMLAGSATIDDEKLRTMANSYTTQCIQRILPDVAQQYDQGSFLDRFFGSGGAEIEMQLAQIQLSQDGGLIYTCRDFKNELRDALYAYANKKHASVNDKTCADIPYCKNGEVSSMLVNHFRNERETLWGVQKASSVPGAAATTYQYLSKIFSWDAFVSMISFGGASDTHGAAEAANRAKEFSELLSRAPHLKGIVLMFLIGLFPWLVFPVVYGKWKTLVWWFWVYLSVCLWTPIWTILYHIMQNTAFTGNVLDHLGHLSDGISMYSSQVVMDRIYYMYSVFAMAQTMVPLITTGLAIYFLRPMLGGVQEETKPDFINDSISAASTGVGVFTGVPGAGVSNVAK